MVRIKSPLVGATAREVNFREKYNASIVSIYREGEHLRKKIGDIQIEGGDTLLLICKKSWVPKLKKNSDFIVVSQVGGSMLRPNYFKLVIAPLISIAMIAVSAAGIIDLLTASLAAAFAMLLTRCLTVQEAIDAIPGRLILVIAGSFGMASALNNTGVAAELADNLVSVLSPIGDFGKVSNFISFHSLFLIFNNSKIFVTKF
jgi:di/tricarboxylate transporter